MDIAKASRQVAVGYQWGSQPLTRALPRRYLTSWLGRPYSRSMTNTGSWKFQHASQTLAYGNETDSRGLKLRRDSGYTHVHMGTADGWLQINVAIRKLDLSERMAANGPRVTP